MARSSLDVAILYWIYPYGDFGSEPGSIPVWAIVETGRHEVCLSPGRALFYFYQLILHVVLLVLLLVSATIQEENILQIQMVTELGDCRPGAPTFAAAQLRLGGPARSTYAYIEALPFKTFTGLTPSKYRELRLS
jgi:hypothetical protein